MNSNSQLHQAIRIPKQFKPDRPVEAGAFYPWVKLMMSLAPWLKREDLDPTEKDLKLISTLAYQNDDLGNAIAAMIMEDGLLANDLEKGLAEGLDSLDNPPSVLVEFLPHYKKLPDFLKQYQPDEELAEKSTEIPIQWRDVPVVFGDALAMSMGFFIGANYPAVGKSMICTGSIAKGYDLAFLLLDKIISGPWSSFKTKKRIGSDSSDGHDVSIYKGSFGVFKGRRS